MNRRGQICSLESVLSLSSESNDMFWPHKFCTWETRRLPVMSSWTVAIVNEKDVKGEFSNLICVFFFSLVPSPTFAIFKWNAIQLWAWRLLSPENSVSPDDQRLPLGFWGFRPLRTLPLCTLNSHLHFTSFLPLLSLWWPGRKYRQRQFSTKMTVLFRLQQRKSYNLCSHILLKMLQRSLYI